METLVFNHLSRKYPGNVFYIRDKYEIDFYVPEKQLIQVCYHLSPIETREREIKALVKASQKVKADKNLIITIDHEEFIKESGLEIFVVPAWKWVLKE